jgi:uncharacterized repeat protein (TIGR01451 family)
LKSKYLYRHAPGLGRHVSGRPVSRLAAMVRRGLVGGAVLAVLAGVLPLAATAQAAVIRPGTLRIAPTFTVAGQTAGTFTFTYTAPFAPVPGTVSLNIPAGFSTPQDNSSDGPGYLSVSSACTTFQVAGLATQPDGSTTVTLSVNCARSLTGTASYTHVTVPVAVAGYPFAASFTPNGSATPLPFPGQRTITVKPGPIASVRISPATATIAFGASQAYTAQGFDAFGNSRGDVTAATKFKITPNGSCTTATCTATAPGAHTVSGTHGRLTGTATLSVAPLGADLAVTETVDHSAPAYYTNVTFTTTVTNLSPTTDSTGVTASVPLPSGLAFVSSSSGGYNASTGVWSVGTVAAGTTATLSITARALDVSFGTQTVTATVSSATSDPNLSNNASSASEASTPAPVAAVVTPDPGNPVNVDISQQAYITWTSSGANADNPGAPVPGGTVQWFCSTGSGNPCPAADGTDLFNHPVLTYWIPSLMADTYTITLQFTPTDPNYQSGAVTTSFSFPTSDSGASP